MSLLSSPPTFNIERVERTYDPLGTTEAEPVVGTVTGWLDMITGTDQPSGALDLAFVEESTHILITRGMPAVPPINDDRLRATDGRAYYVTYVDDVTGVGHHLEIYLRFAGEGATP